MAMDSTSRLFDKIKDALITATLLVHFDPDTPIGLPCDVRAVGIGAVIYHKYADRTKRPIAYASKTLSSSKKSGNQNTLGVKKGKANQKHQSK